MNEAKDINDFKATTSLWTDSIQSVIIDIGQSCQGYKQMNIFASKETTSHYSLLMYMAIVLGPLAGVLSTISSLDSDNYRIYQILIIIFSFVSGAVGAVIKFSNLEQKSLSYRIVANKYGELEGNIRRQLSLEKTERVNAGKYLDFVSVTFDQLFDASPLISEKIYKKWKSYAKENGIQVPKEIGITVNSEEKKIVNNIQVVEEVVRPRAIIYGTETDEEVVSKQLDAKMRYEMSRLSN